MRKEVHLLEKEQRLKTSPSRIIRYIPKKNLMYLPDEPDGVFLTEFTRRPGLVKIELDLNWMRRHACMYNRLMGRPKTSAL